MAKKLYEEEDIREIACALREKCGDETAKYKCCDMPAAIRNLTVGSDPVIKPLTITENGTYTVPTGVDGYNPITVGITGGADKVTEAAIISKSLITYENDIVEVVHTYGFANSVSLTEISLPNVKTIREYGFYYCVKLQNINLPSVESVGKYAFQSNKSLINVDLPAALNIEYGAFRYCDSLTTINLPLAETIGEYAFSECNNLSSVSIPSATTIKGNAFDSEYISPISGVLRFSGKLTYLDLPSVTHMEACCQYQPLTTVILRSPTLVKTEYGGVFCNTPLQAGSNSEGHIYVPRALIDEYKTTAGWSTYTNRYRILEDYTVDGTTTGALDPYLV